MTAHQQFVDLIPIEWGSVHLQANRKLTLVLLQNSECFALHLKCWVAEAHGFCGIRESHATLSQPAENVIGRRPRLSHGEIITEIFASAGRKVDHPAAERP